MIHLRRVLVVRLLLHAADEKPRESCGLLVGPPGQPPVEYHGITNTADGIGQFEMDQKQQLAVYAELDRRGWEPWAVVHSHPDGPFQLSGVDIAHAQLTPEVLQLVAWPRLFDRRDVVVWRVTGAGTATPVDFVLVD